MSNLIITRSTIRAHANWPPLLLSAAILAPEPANRSGAIHPPDPRGASELIKLALALESEGRALLRKRPIESGSGSGSGSAARALELVDPVSVKRRVISQVMRSLFLLLSS